MNYEKCINKIIEFSKRFYNSLDFAHNMEHGKRVVRNAKKIAETEGGDLFLIEAGAGTFAFNYSDGYPYYHGGFRAVLCAE